MNDNTNYNKVKLAMLAMQRHAWEQGVAAQAMYEASTVGKDKDSDARDIFVGMAYDALLRQAPDGRFCAIGDRTGEFTPITDCAAIGEVVLRAYELTGDEKLKNAAEKQLEYLLTKAPRTSSGLICHNTVSFHEGYSDKQVWADGVYMLVPFLAAMRLPGEAQKQADGYMDSLSDLRTNRLGTGLLYHIYDSESRRYISKKLWATGNGWTLLGLARLIGLIDATNAVVRVKYVHKVKKLLDAMGKFQCESGLFRDTLDAADDDSSTFEDATSAMMFATCIYRGLVEGWLEGGEYREKADKVYFAVQNLVGDNGIITGVCGAPHFTSVGTSVEAQAVYIMMEVWRAKCG